MDAGGIVPVESSIDTVNDMVIRTVRGFVTTEDLISDIEGVLRMPEFHPGMNSLTDLREATHQASAQDIRRIAELITRQEERLLGAKAAVVVSQTVSFGMMRMLQAYAEESPLEIGIFYDIGEATRWIGVPL